MPASISTAILVLITIVWAISSLADIFISGFHLDPSMHLIFLAIVGVMFKGKTNGVKANDK